MVRDLDVPVELLPCPTVREPDGLAMSSRNVRLDFDQRADSPRIHASLVSAASCTSADEIVSSARAAIGSSRLARIDYVELVDAETLQPARNLERPTLLAAAVFYGVVRLIDHVSIPAR